MPQGRLLDTLVRLAAFACIIVGEPKLEFFQREKLYLDNRLFCRYSGDILQIFYRQSAVNL